MASETLYNGDLRGARGEAYRAVREKGGEIAYMSDDGEMRRVRYNRPAKQTIELAGETLCAGGPGYWYDKPANGGAGIRVRDGETE